MVFEIIPHPSNVVPSPTSSFNIYKPKTHVLPGRTQLKRKRPSISISVTRFVTTVACCLFALGDVDAFATTKVAPAAFKQTSTVQLTKSSSSTSLNAFNILRNLDLGPSSMADSISDFGSFIFDAASSMLMPVEECGLDGDHLCQDMSMLAESLPSFLKQGDLIVRTGVCLSQILKLSADLLPGHQISMDSLAYQMITIGITSHTLLETVRPMVEASLRANKKRHIAIRDRRTFQDLFAPAGVTWSQYNTMSVSSMEWIAVESGQPLSSDEQEDDDCLYYLYHGDVEVYNAEEGNQDLLYHVEKKEYYKFDDAAGTGLLGEEKLIRHFYNNVQSPAKGNTTIRAGKLGAKVLRIKASKLNGLMHQDRKLSQSMDRLVMQTMQAKLHKGAFDSA